MRSFHRLVHTDAGFDPHSVLTFRMSVPFSGYTDTSKRAELYRQVLERVSVLPGVQSAGAALTMPLSGATVELTFAIRGRPTPPPGQEYAARYNSISPDYFGTMGIPLRTGRFFTEQDRIGAPGAAIINEAMAHRYWPDEDPIGQHLSPDGAISSDAPESFEIVGVVGDVRHGGLDARGEPCMYFPYAQNTWPMMVFALRTTVEPDSLIPAVRREIAGITKEEAAYRFRTVDQHVADSTATRRVPALMTGIFAAVALVLAAVGIYGTLSYSVAQQTHEVGVRMALGAQRGDVLCLVLRQGLMVTGLGLGIGLIISLAGARVLSSLLYEVGAADPLTFCAVSVMLTGVALAACYIPARRATKVDPIVALRYE
jgi:putative ABC transport system permease protein